MLSQMTQVFFYHNASDKLGAACQLLAKAAQARKPVQVYTPDPPVAQAVDRQLWTTPPLSFVPHVRADSPLAPETHILIVEDMAHAPAGDRLMNLAREIPPGYQRYASLIEVVGSEEDDRLSARQRVKAYKAEGCEVQYFDLSNK